MIDFWPQAIFLLKISPKDFLRQQLKKIRALRVLRGLLECPP